MPQETFTFINRSIVGWGDSSSPNTGQSVNSDATYVYVAALYPSAITGHPNNKPMPANTVYTREFLRLSDLLKAQQGLSFANRSVVGWGDSSTLNTGQSVNTNTTYLHVAALYPDPVQGRPANTFYSREFIRVADLLTAQQGLTFVDRSVVGWGDVGGPNRGQPVNTDSTYVYAPALYPAPLQGRPANTFYTPEFIRLSDIINAMRAPT